MFFLPRQEAVCPIYLAINAGSTSIKFALFAADTPLRRIFEGSVDGIGTGSARFSVVGAAASDRFCREFPIPERITAVNVLADWLAERIDSRTLTGIAHRVGYGGAGDRKAQLIDPELMAALYDCLSDDPHHLPLELQLIEKLQRKFAAAAHLACFDTAFHNDMPRVASMLAIPRRYQAMGIRRFGFHGLSCSFLMGELHRMAGSASLGKVVIVHLGGGASVTGVAGGKSRDTTMGLTPAGGVAMGSRSGDLDPGIVWHLSRHEHMTPARFNHMVNHESGMLGISETSGDIHELMANERHDVRAVEALAVFCYQTRKSICAMAGALEGIDTLIFSGGIGENSAEMRARICSPLAFLGVSIDEGLNDVHAPLISPEGGAVAVRVMHSDEQWMIAEVARQLLSETVESFA